MKKMHTFDIIAKIPDEDDYQELKAEYNKLLRVPRHDFFEIYWYIGSSNVQRFVIYRVHFDCLKYLNKVTIEPEDILKLKQALYKYIFTIIDPKLFNIDDWEMYRVDYSFNVVIMEEEKRRALIGTLQGARTKAAYTKRKISYSTSIYNKSERKTIQIYDKAAERKKKGRNIEPYEENVIRYETQVRKDHIRSKAKRGIVTKDIDAWLNWEMYVSYLSEQCKYFCCGDYYSLERAIEHVKKSNYKDSEKRKLCMFLRQVADKGMDYAVETLAYQTIEKYILQLGAIGVNPLTIPNGYGITFIENPLKWLDEKNAVIAKAKNDRLQERKLSKPEKIKSVIEQTDGTITKKEIMERCPDISKVTVELKLLKLSQEGFIVKVGGGRSTAYQKVK